MSRFEQRLNLLEDRVRKHDMLLQDTNLASMPSSNGGPPCHNVAPSLKSSRHVRFGAEISLNAAELQELPPEEAQTDGMAVTFVNEEDTAFFGKWTLSRNTVEADQTRSILQHRLYASYCTCNDAC
jgi:hypothetical protein